jgi:hypothetical protein
MRRIFTNFVTLIWNVALILLTAKCSESLVSPLHINRRSNIGSIQGRFNSRIHKETTALLMIFPEDDVEIIEATSTNDTNEPISRMDAVRKMLQSTGSADDDATDKENMIFKENERRNLAINLVAGGLLVACGVASSQLFMSNVYTPTGFQRLPTTQFIAALGDPKATHGTFNLNDPLSSSWGVWKNDPGPRGVWLRDYDKVFDSNTIAPAGWVFTPSDWWLEEHGLIMEQPKFPIQPGRYLVTGGRSVSTGLTIDKNGNWKLDEGTLYDVTHLPCRSARYRPISAEASPKLANLNDFPVYPGATMPNIPGYSKQDYAVLFLVGVALRQ